MKIKYQFSLIDFLRFYFKDFKKFWINTRIFNFKENLVIYRTSQLKKIAAELEKMDIEKQTENFIKLWKNYFMIAAICKLKLSKKSSATLFNWGNAGYNWENLQLDHTKYKDKNILQLKDIFVKDAMYISDRMEFDRLFRTHWLFRTITNEVIYANFREIE